MEQHFQMLAHYNHWANGLLYCAAADLSDVDYRINLGLFFGSIHGTFNHLLVADRIWMKRFTGEGDQPGQLDSIITDDFIKLREMRNAEDERICNYVESLNAIQLAGRFTYMTATNVRTISQRLAPALAHLFNHQTHHRGQIHAALTRLGADAPSLDLIRFQRSETGRRFA
ncbi:DinB family protein [Brucella gallinifaecis]|uniref:Damage-inducible protein DinB n=1 Tax=Brucella gallinifaecis TaxID=215590 RepID=A0A502BP58_9HYPH|nr:DinB family protein [Brucella gallinifaecis]TPF75985.1 damage-inducible protein DinB [Brucella gallinifaecis]